MGNSRRKLKGWENRVSADVALRESVVRVMSKRPESWGFLLSEVRTMRGWSLAAQAVALGVSESALVFLSVCRSPRQGRFEEDLVAVACRMGIPAAALWFMLDLATEAKAANRRTTTEGAA